MALKLPIAIAFALGGPLVMVGYHVEQKRIKNKLAGIREGRSILFAAHL